MLVIRKFLALGPRGWHDLARAQIALVRWGLAKRFRPKGRLVGAKSDSIESPRSPQHAETRRDSSGDPSHLPLVRAHELALSVDRVARFGLTRPHCLVRSLALRQVLRDEGYSSSSVCFGVRNVGDRLEGHAWVEVGGEILGDDPENIRRFSPVPEIGFLDE